jgi:hypothetical protein
MEGGGGGSMVGLEASFVPSHPLSLSSGYARPYLRLAQQFKVPSFVSVEDQWLTPTGWGTT